MNKKYTISAVAIFLLFVAGILFGQNIFFDNVNANTSSNDSSAALETPSRKPLIAENRDNIGEPPKPSEDPELKVNPKLEK